MGVPYDQTSEKNFKTFSECGFNVSLYIYPSLRRMQEACNISQKYDVRILGHCSESHNSPRKVASVMKNVQGFFGYVLQDEPTADDIRRLQKEINELKKADDSHCFYINLHPYYDKGTLRHLKTNTYEEYLDTVSSIPCRQLSFDYYPITTKGIRQGWYYNLEKIRQQSIKVGKPFWGFVLSVPHNVPFDEGNYYPTPTLASLRLQVYSNLAYGAQAIQYFTYWTPKPTKEWDFHDGPIGLNGHRTKNYRLVKQMNQELRDLLPLFDKAEVLTVNHMVKIPEGTTKLQRTPTNIKKLKITGRKGAIISTFKKDGHLYMAIVNKDYQSDMELYISAKRNVTMLTKQLKESAIKSSYKIGGGDICLFKLK